jgi:uncharacterized membrane protein YiaA
MYYEWEGLFGGMFIYLVGNYQAAKLRNIKS